MKRLLLVAILVVSPLFGYVDETPVDTQAFMAAQRGTYQIVLAGGVVPLEGDSQAEIQPSSKPNEEEFTLPFCQPDGCDPGWLYFPYQKTKITQEGNVYKIAVELNGKIRHFSWEQKGGQIIFRNYQYRMINNNVVTLEHVLKKLNYEEY
jgi:hypothetical protein